MNQMHDRLLIHIVLQERPIYIILASIFLFITINLTTPSHIFAAPHLLPHVSPKMEKPAFWIKKIKNPNRLLLTPEEIQGINEASLKNQDLYLWSVKDLKEEWTREEILSFLREDQEGFGRIDEGRYDKYGNPLKESFWADLQNNLNEDSLKEKNQLLFGLIVKRTDIRFFPTHEIILGSPSNSGSDQIQHSTVPPGSLIGVYHFSEDNLWAYVQTKFVRGWVWAKDLAIAKEKMEAVGYDEVKRRLVITGDFINVYYDLSHQQIALTAQMGTSFPLIDLPERSKKMKNDYIFKIPFRETDGGLTFREGYIPMGKDVHSGFLPYTQEKIAQQAFKMLRQPYGWGEMFGARDCSRFIMDLFSSFGILMPRNSKFQARMGIDLGQTTSMTSKEKEKILDQAMPLATLLRLPGHIMLYLGKDRGRYYAIHNILGIQKAGEFGPVLEKIGRVVVSDLSLGSSGPNGSLLDRITDIRLIGPKQATVKESPTIP